MPSRWTRVARSLARVAAREGPRVLQEVQRRRGAQQLQQPARRPGPAGARPRPGPPAGARRLLVYSPDLDGRADPGEIVWTWVAYEEDPTKGKDRPVLVVGRSSDDLLLGLMLSSQADHDGEPGWHALGSGSWDHERRPSWVRMDRVLDVPEDDIRREGAVLDRARFDRVGAVLRAEHGWR